MMGIREKVVEGMLQLAVQSVEWTYSLYWRFSIQQRMLVWGDGFYNGPIKTTKTLHPAEQPPSLSTLHRTHQLRDLYNSLSSADHPLRRPSAALSPEDLTESEWFYLLCLSFSFPPGLGLPGKAFAKNKHVWITGANEIDTKIFSRAILAKSASIKTVVCIPLMDGVVELGTTEKVNEDMGLIQHIKSIFAETQWGAPKAALSELSTSNSATSLEHNYNNLHSSSGVPAKRKELENDQMDWDSSTSNRNGNGNGNAAAAATTTTPLGNSPAPVEDTHYYSNTLSALLLKLNQSTPWPDSSSVTFSTQSAFSNWTRRSHLHRLPTETTTTSQCLLKNILHTVPFLIHTKRIHSHHNPQNHFLARTEKLNDKFIILRSIVPFATKMDKASILGDTVEYLKQLRQKIQDLEAQSREFESSRRTSFEELQRNAAAPGTCLDKRKLRILEGVGDGCTVLKPTPRPPSPITSLDTNLQVSIIGSDGLLELQCPYQEGLLLDIMLVLQGLRIETTAVRSSMNNGVFIAELRAKVKENMDGKKASILEVKRAIQQIIPCIDT